MQLLHEEMNSGLSKKTNHMADIKMFPTFVRSLPDGTGKHSFLKGKDMHHIVPKVVKVCLLRCYFPLPKF